MESPFLEISINAKLKKPIDGKEYISYPNLRVEFEPELFNQVSNAIINNVQKFMIDEILENLNELNRL